jgi:predicted nuclease of restriction endonuclease-like (RecB) superfamily
VEQEQALAARAGRALFERVAAIIEEARGQVARSVNTAMVHAYWYIGREIIEAEQGGSARAEYGEQLIRRLAESLTERYGKGFSFSNVKRMRQFYLTFPSGSALTTSMASRGRAPVRRRWSPPKGSTALSQSGAPSVVMFPPALGWSHYLVLIRVENPTARRFYEIEAANESWTVRELERQVASLLFERLAKGRDKDRVLTLGKVGQTVQCYDDVLKEPLVLEFLGQKEQPSWREQDLERAIMDRLADFLLELGKGFCFVARQKRITLDGDHYYINLVFYNRLLRAFVLVDLKLGKLMHQDLGQMQMYVNFFDRFQRVEGEAPTVGIILCSDKNEAMVRITLPEDNRQILASRYQLYLPTEEALRKELIDERERVELANNAAGMG